MRATPEQKELFKKGSKTYFNSSFFFPQQIKEKITILYAFVRKADNYVDQIPQDSTGFQQFRYNYYRSLQGSPGGDQVIDSFVELIHSAGLETDWVEAFLDSMNSDLNKSSYNSLSETLEYIYGSAEVIGLFVSRILGLSSEAFTGARMLGRSMQYINFIRDIQEDQQLGRRYLPLNGFDLTALDEQNAADNPDEFERFIAHHLGLYQQWQREAESYYKYIPYKYLVPIKTASDMYNWTAKQIGRNPLVVFRKKIKPGRSKIIFQGLLNCINALKY